MILFHFGLAFLFYADDRRLRVNGRFADNRRQETQINTIVYQLQ